MAPSEMLNTLKKLFANVDVLPSANEQLAKDLRGLLDATKGILSEKHKEIRIIEAMLHYLEAHGVEGPFTKIPKEQRGQEILKVAEEMVAQGQSVVTPKDILYRLEVKAIDLAVMQPRTVIGNVLARSPKFRRLARNQFEWIGDK